MKRSVLEPRHDPGRRFDWLQPLRNTEDDLFLDQIIEINSEQIVLRQMLHPKIWSIRIIFGMKIIA